MKLVIKELHIHESSRVNEMKMLKRLELLSGLLNMKVSELAAKLNNQTATVEKIITEIQALKVALEAEEAIAALNRLGDALTVADDINPDAPVV